MILEQKKRTVMKKSWSSLNKVLKLVLKQKSKMGQGRYEGRSSLSRAPGRASAGIKPAAAGKSGSEPRATRQGWQGRRKGGVFMGKGTDMCKTLK